MKAEPRGRSDDAVADRSPVGRSPSSRSTGAPAGPESGEAATPTPRVLGRLRGPRPGPTLLLVAGIHGNEPAGVEAARRVVAALRSREGRIRGELAALTGNRAALVAGRRYLARDLNRAWTPAEIRRLRRGRGAMGAEAGEQLELLDVLNRITDEARGPVFVLDLHTTSGAGGVFTTVSDTLPNRAFGLALPVPLVLGLEERVEGTLHEYLGSRGYVSAAFEGGAHDDPASTIHSEAAIWLAVSAAGLLPEHEVPETTAARKELSRATRHLPRVVEIRARHAVAAGDGFRMRPGFTSFQPVGRGEPVADDVRGEVRVTEPGRLLMPLYQEQGSDGFFVVREFRPFWLHLSRLLRHAGAGRVVHWLPGIRRSEERPEALEVDRRVARWYALELLHLLGYRREREVGSRLVVLRRRPDRPSSGG